MENVIGRSEMLLPHAAFKGTASADADTAR